MTKENYCLYEPDAFWTMLAAQQVVTLFAIWKLVVVLRLQSMPLVLLYQLVILFSLGTCYTARTVYFLNVVFEYTEFIFELLDVTAISVYLCVMIVICWMWWDVYLQFGLSPHIRWVNTFAHIVLGVLLFTWNIVSLCVFHATGNARLANH